MTNPASRIESTDESLRWRTLLLLFSLLLIAQGFYFFHQTGSAPVAPFLAIEIALAGPILFAAARTIALKWASLYLTQIGIAYGATLFFIENWTVWGRNVLVNESTLTDALAVAAVGVASAALGIIWGSRQRLQNLKQQEPLSFGPLWGSWLWWLLSYAATISVNQLWNPGSLGYLGIMMAHWPLTSILALDILARSGRAPVQVKRFAWWALVPFRMILNLGTGFVGFVMNEGIVLLFYLTMRRVIRIRIYGVLICGTLLILAYGVRSYIRESIWIQDEGPKSRIAITVTAIEAMWNSSWIEGYLELLKSLGANRLGHYVLVAHTVVVQDTPESIPYLYGESFSQLLWTIVLRVLYPEKPIESWGQEFGHRYRLLAPTDDQTSFNFPQLTEFYANGGIGLVLILMYFVSIVVHRVALWTERLERDSADVLWLILPLVFGALTQAFSNLSLSVNAAVYNAMILGIPTLITSRINREGGTM